MATLLTDKPSEGKTKGNYSKQGDSVTIISDYFEEQDKTPNDVLIVENIKTKVRFSVKRNELTI